MDIELSIEDISFRNEVKGFFKLTLELSGTHDIKKRKKKNNLNFIFKIVFQGAYS